MSRSTEVDITVYGATSFVAKHVLTYLMQRSVELDAPLHVTLAGRNQNKLDVLQKHFATKVGHLSTIHADAKGKCVFDTFVAEASDAKALEKMAARTKAVIACAGPFSRYGTLVVAACARKGADYVDITGEVSWAARMRSMYGDDAKKSGARIISFCGFDSIPSDLVIFLAVQKLKEKSNKPVEKALTWHHCLGGANGGTLITAAETKFDLKKCFSQPVPFFLEDPLALAHPRVRTDPKSQDMKNRMAKTEWLNQLPAIHTIFRLGASAPFVMAIINAKVVQASAVALNYGPNFVYKERFLPTGFKLTMGIKLLSIIPVLVTQMVLMYVGVVLRIPVMGKWLINTFMPPGSGMDDEICRVGFSEVYAEVSTASDEKDGLDRANARLKFKGDPGNWTTAQCVSESALSLVLDKEKLPPRSEDGFGTPAELLGPVLLERLQDNKVRPMEVDFSVRRGITYSEWQMFP